MPFELPQSVGVLLPLVVLLVLLAVSRFALRWLIALVAGPAIGRKALDRQPDRIALHPAGADPWTHREWPQRTAAELTAAGFRSAGVHGIDALPGVLVELFAHTEASAWAAIYEHAQGGLWFDLYSHAGDGTAFTLSSRAASGMDPQPGKTVVHAPAIAVARAWERFQRERPASAWRPATTDGAVAAFEHAWEESIAWRKGKGVSRTEVMRVASKRAA